MAESGSTSIDHFIRQRRNLILVSLLIIFYKVAELEMRQINLLGNEVSIGNPAIVLSALSIFFFYFLWRYYTACREINGIGRFWFMCTSWAERKCTEFVRNKYFPKLRDNERRVDLIGRGNSVLTFRIYENPDDRTIPGKEITVRGQYWLMSVISIFPVIIRTSNFSEYFLPYILSLVALAELANVGFVSSVFPAIASTIGTASGQGVMAGWSEISAVVRHESYKVNECVYSFLGLCFVKPNEAASGISIFGFAEYVSALALLVIIYTLSDIRYKFRVYIAPIRLYALTYVLIAIIGFGTLLIDVWSASLWPVPQTPITRYMLQGTLGFSFLFLVLTWVFYAFIRPPVFNKRNAERFAHELLRIILKGSEDEMPVIAHELGRSARQIVSISRMIPSKARSNDDSSSEKPVSRDWAYEILLMIGTRRLCRYIVSSSPATAMEFFSAFSEKIDKSLPVGQFVSNISTEAILNTDSILYHEDEGYYSGWLGYVRPFSKAIYGDYELIEALSQNHSSPLHLSPRTSWDFSSVQFEAYTRAALMTFESYVMKHKNGNAHSYALYHAFEKIGHMAYGIYKVDGLQSPYSEEAVSKLKIAVQFASDCVRILNKYSNPPTVLATKKDYRDKDIYDRVADLMFKIILSASSVKSPSDTAWWIHYNMVWSDFFISLDRGAAQNVIQYRLRRLLYDEICQLSDIPNFQSAGALGICLNVLGLKTHKRSYQQDQVALHKAILSWLKKNYLILRERQYKVADACIIGSITYDQEHKRIIKTYIEGLSLVAPQEYLDLVPLEGATNSA